MQASGRWRALFLQPEPPESPESPGKPTRAQLAALSRAERRRAKVAYQSHSGVFRTWVYVVALVGLVGGFAIYLLVVG